MAWGGKSFDSMSSEEQDDSRFKMLALRCERAERENAGLAARNRFLEDCLTRNMVDVFDENERLKREHEEMRLRLVSWQSGVR